MNIVKGEPVPWGEYERVHRAVGDLTLAVSILVKRELDRMADGSEVLEVSRLEGREFAPGQYYLQIDQVADKMIFSIGDHRAPAKTDQEDDGGAEDGRFADPQN